MALDLTRPDPSVVLDLLEAFRRSKTMFAAVTLGVFEALESGPKSTAALAKTLGADADALGRLLDACVALKLLEHPEGGYANTEAAAAYLCERSPRRLTGYLNYSNDVMWKLWTHLEDAVREGGHRWKQAYGWDGPIFSHFFRDEAALREFSMGMHGFGGISSPVVVGAFDLSRFRKLVDLGGATGHLAVAACERWPDLRGVVFDLPAVVPLARELVSAGAVANRVDIIAGDFFTDELPDADLFALGRILHDWTEAKAVSLLKRIHDRLPAEGALLIVEKLLDDDRSGPRWANMQDLNMLTCTEGKERTLGEYEALVKAAGFRELRGCRLAVPSDAMLALK